MNQASSLAIRFVLPGNAACGASQRDPLNGAALTHGPAGSAHGVTPPIDRPQTQPRITSNPTDRQRRLLERSNSADHRSAAGHNNPHRAFWPAL
jgi:hypothetical protein